MQYLSPFCLWELHLNIYNTDHSIDFTTVISFTNEPLWSYVAACARTTTPPAQRLGLRGESDAMANHSGSCWSRVWEGRVMLFTWSLQYTSLQRCLIDHSDLSITLNSTEVIGYKWYLHHYRSSTLHMDVNKSGTDVPGSVKPAQQTHSY